MRPYIILIFALLFLASAPAFAGFPEGKRAYSERDWSRALSELRQAVNAGDDRAMFLLGKMYENGDGVTQNFKEAFSLYKRAVSEKNNTDAMTAMGLIWSGKTVARKDLKMTMQWLLRAAQLGNGTAAYHYAIIISGNGKEPVKEVPLDYYNAYKWFKMAAAADPEHSSFRGGSENMAMILSMYKLTAANVAKADKELKAWQPATPASLGPLPPFPEIVEKKP